MKRADINTRLRPRRAIIIYNDGPMKEDSWRGATNFYLESREISNGRLGAAEPLDDDCMKRVAQVYMKKNAFDMQHSALIDEHLLHASNKLGRTVVMWWRPTMLRNLQFGSGTGMRAGKAAMLPATLYLVIDRELFVWALDKSTRPGPKTKLYHAPFFNIYDGANVCLGSAKVGTQKARTFEEEAERFERGFYMAEQGGGHVNYKAGALKRIWTALMGTGKAFPVKELLPHKKFSTLQHAIEKLIKAKNDNYENDSEEEDEIEEEAEIEIGA